jgi:hypothetical protein
MPNNYFTPPVAPSAHSIARIAHVNDLTAATDAAFDLLPEVAQITQGVQTAADDTGAANAYVVTLPTTITTYDDYQQVVFKAANSNTGPSTINIDGVGVKAIQQYDGTPLEAGDILQDSIIEVRYDGTAFRIMAPGAQFATSASASEAAAAASVIAAAASENAAATSASNASSSASAAAASESAAAISAATVNLPSIGGASVGDLLQVNAGVTGYDHIDPATIGFASGTVMVFYQASAPTGWTQVTSATDKALRVVDDGTGGTTGGTHGLTASPSTSHTHTGPSHTHSGPSHTHSGPSHTHTSSAHTHSGPSHTHTTSAHTLTSGETGSHTHNAAGEQSPGGSNKVLSASGVKTDSLSSTSLSGIVQTSTGGGGSHDHGATGSASGTTGSGGGAATGSASGTTGSASGTTGSGGTGATGSTSPTKFDPAYANIIICSKDA